MLKKLTFYENVLIDCIFDWKLKIVLFWLGNKMCKWGQQVKFETLMKKNLSYNFFKRVFYHK